MHRSSQWRQPLIINVRYCTPRLRKSLICLASDSHMISNHNLLFCYVRILILAFCTEDGDGI